MMLPSLGFCLLSFPSTFPFFALLQPPSLLALWSCTAAFPSILLPVCLIAGHGYVVYLKQNRTPLLFQRVEPPSSTHDGEPGLNNTLPPPEAADNVNSLWVGCCWLGWFIERALLKCVRVCHRSVQGGVPESHSWMTARAQEMSQKIGSWSPEGIPEDGLGSMTNSQVEITDNDLLRHPSSSFLTYLNVILCGLLPDYLLSCFHLQSRLWFHFSLLFQLADLPERPDWSSHLWSFVIGLHSDSKHHKYYDLVFTYCISTSNRVPSGSSKHFILERLKLPSAVTLSFLSCCNDKLPPGGAVVAHICTGESCAWNKSDCRKKWFLMQ